MGFNCTVTEIQNRGDGPIGFLWSFITLKMLVIKNDLITLCPITAEGKEENMAMMNCSSSSEFTRSNKIWIFMTKVKFHVKNSS